MPKVPVIGLAKGAGIEILSYKRDRGLSVLRLGEDEFKVIEWGYCEQEMLLKPDELSKAMKTFIKREFPRSRKVRTYNLTGVEDLARQRKKL